MRISSIIWARFKLRNCFCVCNQICYGYSSDVRLHNCIPTCYNLNSNSSSSLKEVLNRISYSTKSDPLNSDRSEDTKTNVKKKKEFKVYITLLGSDDNIISITTVEEATKISSRRKLRLVKILDLDPKTGRAVYKLMSESDYLKQDTDWEDTKLKKEKEKFVKGDKLVSLTSSTAERDVLTKAKMMQKWIVKRYEVRVVITGDKIKGENIFKIIEKEIGTLGRIVQKRYKGEDIRFQIIPQKKTEPPQSKEPHVQTDGTKNVNGET